MGYVDQNIFYVGHIFYVGYVGQIYFCVGQNFCVGQFFFRRSKFSVCELNFMRGSKFLHGSIFGG